MPAFQALVADIADRCDVLPPAMAATATNLVPPDLNGYADAFVSDLG